MDANQQNDKQKPGMGILVFLALIIVAGLLLPGVLGSLVKDRNGEPSPGAGLALTWLVVAIFMLFIIGSIGISLNKGRGGVLIDPATNMMSLSRLQIVLWTWVVLSAFVTVALARVGDSISNSAGYCNPAQGQQEGEVTCADPLGVQLPPLLWTLMGISVTSAVASPLLKAGKAQRTEGDDQRRMREASKRKSRGEPDELATYRDALKNRTRDDPELARDLRNEGVLVKKSHWTLAKFSDVFMGEEVTNFMYVDVAKVQNLFFTVIAVTAYTVALAVEMSISGSIAGFFLFPDLPAGLMAVISISHGGYLTDKAFPHSTPETPDPPPCRWKGEEYDHGTSVKDENDNEYTCVDGSWFTRADPPE
jgi:hypothetical protein